MSKTILIVDDEADVVEVVKKRLESKGYKIAVAANGLEGLNYVRSHKVDLIVLDIMMPVMDGSEMAERLKSDVKTQMIPIIFLSAILDKQESLSSNYGPNIVLAKPFDSEELLTKIHLLLSDE